jgi:glyoxalase family protein
MPDITGIHHVTAICGDAQENLDFYTGVLGMRLVKRSVNQDDPKTYHLFYADADGHPGTDLTFFPFQHSPPGKLGHGLGVEIGLAIPEDGIAFWRERLRSHGVPIGDIETRHGEPTITFADPHGQRLFLTATPDPREFTPWDKSPVPAERQILGLHAVRLWERDLTLTADFLTTILEFTPYGVEDGWHRYGVEGGGSGKHIEIRETPNLGRGAWGVGTMHHVAWRVADEAVELRMREKIAAARRRPTEVIDRFWFKSVYFLEPGGVLFEIATEGPGFTADEDHAHLGERLVLPPWLEVQRPSIESALPPLHDADLESFSTSRSTSAPE